jgi:uncharacterized membrane protein
MDTKRFGVATLVGGIALFAVGYLIFNVMFASFYAANVGSATGVDRTSQIQWAMAVGNLAYAALIAFVLERGGGTVSIGDGIKVGAIVGFLIWCTADFTFYGATNIATLLRTSVDPLLEIVHGGIAGAAVAAVAYRSAAVAKAVA